MEQRRKHRRCLSRPGLFGREEGEANRHGSSTRFAAAVGPSLGSRWHAVHRGFTATPLPRGLWTAPGGRGSPRRATQAALARKARPAGCPTRVACTSLASREGAPNPEQRGQPGRGSSVATADVLETHRVRWHRPLRAPCASARRLVSFWRPVARLPEARRGSGRAVTGDRPSRRVLAVCGVSGWAVLGSGTLGASGPNTRG